MARSSELFAAIKMTGGLLFHSCSSYTTPDPSLATSSPRRTTSRSRFCGWRRVRRRPIMSDEVRTSNPWLSKNDCKRCRRASSRSASKTAGFFIARPSLATYPASDARPAVSATCKPQEQEDEVLARLMPAPALLTRALYMNQKTLDVNRIKEITETKTLARWERESALGFLLLSCPSWPFPLQRTGRHFQ